MSGLLAKLVARAHGTLPEVAPRPVSHFENDDAGGPLDLEETVLETGPPRHAPPPRAAPPPESPPVTTAVPAATLPTPAEHKAPAPAEPAVPPPSVAPSATTPAEQPASVRIAAPGPAPVQTLREVEHQERIEREVRREVIRTSDVPGQRPPISPTTPAASPPAPAAVATRHLVEMVERIAGHPPATEQGDPNYPIWSGCWFHNTGEVPALALAAAPGISNVVVQTQGQNTLMLSDTPGPTGGILLKSTTGALISINDIGITITNGKGATILLAGKSVTVNEGARS